MEPPIFFGPPKFTELHVGYCNSECFRCAQPLCVIISCDKKLVDMPLSSIKKGFVDVHYSYNSRTSNSEKSKIFLPQNDCNTQ